MDESARIIEQVRNKRTQLLATLKYSMATSFAKRLAEIGKLWVKTKKAERTSVPDGRYQAEITKAQLQEVKSGKSQGAPVIVVTFKVLAGDFKGQTTRRTYWMAAVSKSDGQSVGISFLKRDAETLELEVPKEFTEKSIKKLLDGMIGCCVEIRVVEKDNGFNDLYIDRLINAEAAEGDDEEDEDEDEAEEEDADDEEESEEDEDSDDEEEDSDDDEDSEDEDDEDVEDDEDEDEDEEEEKPAKRGPGRPKGSKNKPKTPPEKKKVKKGKDDEAEEDAEELWEKAVGD